MLDTEEESHVMEDATGLQAIPCEALLHLADTAASTVVAHAEPCRCVLDAPGRLESFAVWGDQAQDAYSIFGLVMAM